MNLPEMFNMDMYSDLFSDPTHPKNINKELLKEINDNIKEGAGISRIILSKSSNDSWIEYDNGVQTYCSGVPTNFPGIKDNAIYMELIQRAEVDYI